MPGYPDWYNVVYDDDTSVYTYKLLDDYKNNDLKIIPEVLEQGCFLPVAESMVFSSLIQEACCSNALSYNNRETNESYHYLNCFICLSNVTCFAAYIPSTYLHAVCYL